MTGELRIGTRGSPLALAQANETRDRLCAAHPEMDPDAITIEVIRTTGDRMQAGPLSAIGGKGLFTKEIEEALLAGRIDIAVHSMKDVPTALPDGLGIFCYLPREDPRDAFICRTAANLAELPAGSVIGTASLRRQALILNRRPDLKVVTFRGNVETRLRKLEDGVADATLLAYAGLRRLGRADAATAVLAAEDMLPAVCQGAVGIECRADDAATRDRLAPLNHKDTEIRALAERALLAGLDGSCRTPIAALAELGKNGLSLRAQIVRPDGSDLLEAARKSAVTDAVAAGRDAADELRRRAGPGFFSAET